MNLGTAGFARGNDLPQQYRFTTVENLQSQVNALSKKIRSSSQILYNNGPLDGEVCKCYVFGIDYTNGNFYYKDENGVWQLKVTSGGGGGNFDATVDFSVNANPNTVGTTFSPNTPGLTTVLYVSTIDNSQWVYNGTIYVTYISPFWTTSGNPNVNSSNFIGSLNNESLKFRTNNSEKARISESGEFIINGFLTPAGYNSKLYVVGNSYINGRIYNSGGISIGSSPVVGSGALIDIQQVGTISSRIATQSNPLSGGRAIQSFVYNTAGISGGAGNAPSDIGWRHGLNTGGSGGYTPSFDYTIDEISYPGPGQFTNRFRIQRNTGFIGIGNGNLNSPTEQLDVTGNIRLSGAFMPNNNAGTVGQVLVSQGTSASPIWASAGSGSGEINTASNTGSIGVGLFKIKTLENLEFYKINPGSTMVSINLNGTDRVDINVVPSEFTGIPQSGILGLSATFLSKENLITVGTTAQYWRGDKTWQTLDKTAVGLGNIDNTSDLNKPVSTATQTALNGKEDSIAAGTTAQYWRGDKTWQTLPTVGSVNFIDGETPSGVMDSVNTAFTIANTPIAGSVHLYLRGTRRKAGVDYTITGNTITMIDIPDSGDELLVDYRY